MCQGMKRVSSDRLSFVYILQSDESVKEGVMKS